MLLPMNNLNLKFFIFYVILFFFIYFILSIEQSTNNLIPSYNFLHSIRLILIIHLISMIFMNSKITINLMLKVQKYQSYFYFNILYKI